MTFLAFYLLDHHYKDFIKWRHRYLRALESNRNRDLGVHGRTIMVENIPNETQTDNALKSYFSNLFPNCVDSARVTRDISEMAIKVKERDEVYRNLIDAKVQLFDNLRAAGIDLDSAEEDESVNVEYRPRHSKTMVPRSINILGGEEVDSITFYRTELHRLNKELKALVDGDQFKPLASGVGFVTFHDSATANQAVQLLLSTNSNCFVTRRAPEPRDICWENMAKPRPISTFFSVRSVIVWALTLTLLFLWAVSEHGFYPANLYHWLTL